MVTKERDEELALFLEMRRRDNDKDKAHNNNNFLENSDCLDACLGTFNPRGSSAPNIPARKTAAEKFLDSENDKSDYDWLITPPRTPSLEMEPRKNAMSQNGMPNACVTALKTRLTNIQEEPASRTNIGSKRITLPSALNSSNCTSRKPTSTSATRPATPTGRATLPASTKPSRSSTPTSRATMPSSKPGPVRSSTPARTITRSSTPVGRPSSVPALKSAARSSTPTHQMSTPASAPSMAASARGRSASVTRSASSTLKNPVPLRSNSPAKNSRSMKPYEMPGFSLDAPPNLRTSLPERPASASRGRPGGTNARSSYVETGSKGRPRQQSCSPARGRASNSSANGGCIIPSKSRTLSNGSDDVNPVLMGTKMVERVVNMRKLAPPKQDDQQSTHTSSCGLDSTGFGRTLSKKSLDMALRHMDIRRSVPGKLRPLTSIPASSVYSVRSGGSTKSKTNSFLGSPLATSSNASSEISVNNCHLFDRTETEVNDYGSERGNTSPISQSGK